MSPGLYGEEKTELGKTPIGVIRRIVQFSSPKKWIGSRFFAGSGIAGGIVWNWEDNSYYLIIISTALEVMARRLANVNNIDWINFDPKTFQSDNI